VRAIGGLGEEGIEALFVTTVRAAAKEKA